MKLIKKIALIATVALCATPAVQLKADFDFTTRLLVGGAASAGCVFSAYKAISNGLLFYKLKNMTIDQFGKSIDDTISRQNGVSISYFAKANCQHKSQLEQTFRQDKRNILLRSAGWGIASILAGYTAYKLFPSK